MGENTLHGYFLESAVRCPERPALCADGSVWSYGDLAAIQRTVSGLLGPRTTGQPQRSVGLMASKAGSVYGALLGVMASGSIHVPLHPRFPVDRLTRIVHEAELSAIILDAGDAQAGAALLERCERPLRVIVLGGTLPPGLPGLAKHELIRVDEPMSGPGGSQPSARVSPEDHAYILFTSGTTGRPKGVPVTHANATACIEAAWERFPLSETDRVTQFSDLTFDVSVAEIFLAWKAGACVYAPGFVDLMVPDEFVNRHRLTVWSSVPTMASHLSSLGRLVPGAMPSLRCSLFCGEPLSYQLALEWQQAAPASEVVNVYGPTEASIFATSHVFDPAAPLAGPTVPIGVPLRGMSCKVVEEEDGALREASGRGELLLAGPQVVSGYWRNAEATEQAFVRLAGDPDRVWYRTRDLVTVNEAHELVFGGRSDHQVKLRGYRIELLEIEMVIREAAGASLVAVVPVYAGDGRCEDLVAYVAGGVAAEGVLEKCRNTLPEYMLPGRIVSLERFPLSASGKVDYHALGQMAVAG